LATATASMSSATTTSTTPLARWTSIGPIVLRREAPEPASLDHRRARHPEVGALGRDDDVGAAGQGRVAGEAAAVDDRDRGDRPDRRANRAKASASSHDPEHVGVARPTPAALGEHTSAAAAGGPARTAGPSCGGCLALGAGEDGVVVGRHTPPASPRARTVGVDRAGPGHEAVGGGAPLQVLELPTATLRRDGEAAVLGEAAVVEQVGEVLAGGALTAGVPLGHRVGALGVETHTMSFDDLTDVVTVEPGRGAARRRCGCRAPVSVVGGGDPLRDPDQFLTDDHRRPGLDRDDLHDATDRRHDLVVHLHRLDEGDHVARSDVRTDLDEQAHDGALEW
jgi:hypothetical protein